VALPLRWPGVLAAGCVALILAIGELAATVLVVPPGVSTLSIRIFGLMHYGAEDRVAALCLAIWLLTGLVTVAAVACMERRGKTR
jgi:iron(III) transport system permease protein